MPKLTLDTALLTMVLTCNLYTKKHAFKISCHLHNIVYCLLYTVGVCLTRCVLLKDSSVKSHSWISSSIIGWKSVVGHWVSTSWFNPLHAEKAKINVWQERKGPGWGNNPYSQPVTELRRTRLRQLPYVPYLYDHR